MDKDAFTIGLIAGAIAVWAVVIGIINANRLDRIEKRLDRIEAQIKVEAAK